MPQVWGGYIIWAPWKFHFPEDSVENLSPTSVPSSVLNPVTGNNSDPLSLSALLFT